MCADIYIYIYNIRSVYKTYICTKLWSCSRVKYRVLQSSVQYCAQRIVTLGYIFLCRLETSGKLMDLSHKNGTLRVNYSDRLVSLLREVRQLTGLGYPIPAKIQQCANTAQKFYKHAIVLKQVSIRTYTVMHTYTQVALFIYKFIKNHLQVAHFYNTIHNQMLPCQQAMMLDSALAFEKLVKSPKPGQNAPDSAFQVTWDNPKELEAYIDKLHSAAEKLTTQNRRLRKHHQQISDKVKYII